MAESLITKKYAKALLDVARIHQQIEELSMEVLELEKSLEQSHAVPFLTDPIVPEKEKSELINKVAEKASIYLSNFLKTIAENGRYAILYDSLFSFRKLANKELGHDEVEVITTVTISETQKQRMIKLIKAEFNLNAVTLINHVNEKILGGFIIQNKTKVLDASVKSQLAKIANEL